MLPKLIAQLGGDDVKASLRSAGRLKDFGAQASPALFQALADKPSPIVRRRIEEVLEALGEYPIPPAELQRSRAIQILEQIGAPDAVEILRKLAQANPPTNASRDAATALKRLQARLRLRK